MTCPAFLLNGYSLLDYSLHWLDHPDLLYEISTTTGHEQLIAVTRWFLSTLYGSYHSRCTGQSSEKKPFNPVLGEFITCNWRDDNNVGWKDANMFIEQVSHHPPVSAFSIHMNSPSKITVQGHCGQKTVFSTGAIKVSQVGRVKIQVGDAEFTIFPLPDLSVAGLLSGRIFVELLGKTVIKSSTGMNCEIEFIPKGWFSGEYFQIKGLLNDNDGSQIGKISGNWTAKTFVDFNEQKALLFDSSTAPATRTIKPIEEQKELESHRLWKPVKEYLVVGNYSEATAAKLEIEEYQRAIRKKRQQNEEKWVPQFFQFVHATGEDGATAMDPQQTGGVATGEVGHWVIK
jgi:hypothetical protein